MFVYFEKDENFKHFFMYLLKKYHYPRHVSFSSPPFHPSMQHPKFYTLSISSMILHFYHFLTCLIIPWISSCTISNSISQNVISSQPFHPHLKCLPFHPCIFHPRMTRIGWKRRVEYANMKLLG